ncbi:MAG: NAD(P)-dependent oxidoreductase [Candidatus Pacearchaeota archaeon]|nr:NAD(P)-dependent oxidoreductase [Candidatus Pacearchaeota archaeon]
MKKRSILVCGATGFIGRNVTEFLAEKDEFEIYGTFFNSNPYYTPNIKLVRCDLTDKNSVQEIVREKDVVIQMAAITSGAKEIKERPYIHVTDNAVMNSLLLRAVFDNNVSQFIFPSSSTVYPSSDRALKEEDSGDIFPAYFGSAKTKLYIEDMCKFFSKFGRTKYTLFRHSNIYGPYDKYDLEKSHVFGATITKVMKEDKEAEVWGTGEEERDLLHVSDLCNFVYTSLNQTSNLELVNIGSGEAISVRNLVKKIMDISGKDLEIKFLLDKPTIKTRVHLDISKAKRVFGWEPKVSLDEGIRRTIEWYKENIK